MIAYWTIRWRLMAVPGVANVNVWGDRWKQLQLQFDPEKLQRARVTIDDAQSVASDALDFGLLKYTDAAKNRVGGFIESPNQRLGIHHVLPVFDPASLARVTVADRYKRRRDAARPRRPGRRWRGATSRSSATPSSTTTRASCSWSRSSRGRTRST